MMPSQPVPSYQGKEKKKKSEGETAKKRKGPGEQEN